MKPEKKTSPRKKTAGKRAAESPEAKPRARTTRAVRPAAAARVAAAHVKAPAAPQLKTRSRTKSARAPRKQSTTPAKPARRKRAIKVPPILLEGDAPLTPAVSGPGQRYALGPTPPPVHFGPAEE